MGLLNAINPPEVCADRAGQVLAGYAGNRDDLNGLRDLLTDLAHFTTEQGWDFEQLARDAQFQAITERMS